MKTPLLYVVTSLALGGGHLLAQTSTSPASGMVSSTAISARDGFTMAGTSVMFTRGGVSQKVEKEMTLENGLRVQPDGKVLLPNGDKTAIGPNQILTPQGTLETVALTSQGVAPVTTGGSPLRKQGEEVGLSATDGIIISGDAAFVTRNGVSEQISKELQLSNGARVMPNGGVTFSDGTQITLRANQILGLDGVVREAPVRSTGKGGAFPAGSGTSGMSSDSSVR